MSTPRGFTLIELMVTVSVMAILLGVGAPAMQTMIANNQQATQTNELIAALQLARSEATKLNRSVRFCRVGSANSTECSNGATWEHWTILDYTLDESNPVLLRRGSFNPNSNITLSSSYGASIIGLDMRPTGLINIAQTTTTDNIVIAVSTTGANSNSVRHVGPTGQIYNPKIVATAPPGDGETTPPPDDDPGASAE